MMQILLPNFMIIFHTIIEYLNYLTKLLRNNIQISMAQRNLILSQLLYSGSQYNDEEPDLNDQLQSVNQKYAHEFSEGIDDDAVQLGNGQSVQHDNWNDDYQSAEWNNQQQAQFCFREVAGNSQQFSRSLSIHRHDHLQSRGMHDSSVNLQNILNNKKKQQEKVNEVIEAQLTPLLQQNQKLKCLNQGLKKKINKLNETIQNITQENNQLIEQNGGFLKKLQKKDQLFNQVKLGYKQSNQKFEERDNQFLGLVNKYKSLENQYQRLREVIRMQTDQQRNLLDFRPNAIKKHSDRSRSPIKQYPDKQLEKLRRDNSALQTQYSFLQGKISEHKDKMKSLEDQCRRKVSIKQKKLKELSEDLQEARQQFSKAKKMGDSTVHNQKQKIYRFQKQIAEKEEKIKQLETKSKHSLDQIRKKQQKIKQLLTQVQQKNKRLNQTMNKLEQQQAKNQIQTKLQKQRETQIDKLEQQVAKLKTQKYDVEVKLEQMQKPSVIEARLKKQNQSLKSTNQKLNRKNKQLQKDMDNYEKQTEEKDSKIRDIKKKNEELNKKIIANNSQNNQNSNLILNKKKSLNQEKILQDKEMLELKDLVNKLRKENAQLKIIVEQNQQKVNRLFILQTRLQGKFEGIQNQDDQQLQNCYSLEEQIDALQQQIQFKDEEINNLKQAHLMQIQRLNEQIKTLQTSINEREVDLQFKQKSLDYMHQKFVRMQKQNTQLRAKRNILHSSFYDEDESYERQNLSSTIQFLKNKVHTLEQLLQDREKSISKLSSNQNKDRENTTTRFQNNKLKSRVKQLTQMLLTNQNRKIAPQSLSQQETIEFLQKTIRRILKSADMIRTLAKIQQFRNMLNRLQKLLEKQGSLLYSKDTNGNQNYNYNQTSHTNIGSYRR